MKNTTLNDGNLIPQIGFGTYKATREEGIESVKNALQSGYRFLDTAAKYDNEEDVGEGIKQSGIPREEIIVTSKVWRENMSYDNTKTALAESLKKLQLDYLDLYLIHWPANERNYGAGWKNANAEVWRAMEDLQAEGLVKSIGVSNFWPEHLEALLETAKVKPAINQIEFHPGYWQPEVLKFSQDLGITVESWSPFARGRIFGNEVLERIAEKHQKTVSQIALRWIVQHGVIAIPKSTTLERIKENPEIDDFELSDDEMLLINGIPEMGFSGELPNLWPEVLPKN